MYAALWSILPGPLWVRILILFALIIAVVLALMTWVFPWIDSYLSAGDQGTVGPQ